MLNNVHVILLKEQSHRFDERRNSSSQVHLSKCILIKVLLKKQSGRVFYGRSGSRKIPQPLQFFSVRAATLIFSDFYFYNLTRFLEDYISGVVSSNGTFNYLIWKNSQKVTKTAKSLKKIVKKWVKIWWHQLKTLVSLVKALGAIIYSYVFSLYPLHNIFLFVFPLFLVQLYFVQLWFPPLFQLVSGIKTSRCPV